MIFYYFLEEQIINSNLNQTELVIFLIDIDNFKLINDNYGHVIGDKALQNLTLIIKNKITSNEIPCRYGGDELVVICPNKNINENYLIAENIRKEIDSKNLIEETKTHPKIKCTISIGIASLKTINCNEINCFLEQADIKLYEAKKLGKNRVIY